MALGRKRNRQCFQDVLNMELRWVNFRWLLQPYLEVVWVEFRQELKIEGGRRHTGNVLRPQFPTNWASSLRWLERLILHLENVPHKIRSIQSKRRM